jgi:endonuclease G
MKKVLIGMLALLLACLFLAFNKNLPNLDIKTPIYHIVYSQEFEQPLEIDYKVQCNKNSKGYYSRGGMDFYIEKNIHTSDYKDYYKNVWDKGHMAPAGDFNCNLQSLKQTFSYVNCALQHQDLNRGAWKELEAYEKELAINNIVTIRILVDFSRSIRGTAGAMIPTGFTKIITLNGKLFKSYYFPNESVKENYEKYLIKKY